VHRDWLAARDQRIDVRVRTARKIENSDRGAGLSQRSDVPAAEPSRAASDDGDLAREAEQTSEIGGRRHEDRLSLSHSQPGTYEGYGRPPMQEIGDAPHRGATRKAADTNDASQMFRI
jgi:hypothetical protein